MDRQNDDQLTFKLWDFPVRLVHWGLAVLLPSLWWTWRSGDLALHQKLGLVALGLLLFRILWGIFGSSTARFTHFVKGPREIAAYLRGRSASSVGHNPLGALSVIGLLGLMIVEVGFGLIAQDVDGEESGPLAQYVSYETADWARGWHALLFNMIVALVAAHVLAILFYLIVKRDNLVGPMVTGRKAYKSGVSEPWMAPAWRMVAAAVVAAGAAWWTSTGLKI